MSDKRLFLKVKLKTLMAESKIIRKEEMRRKGPIRDQLAVHRRGVVREETRLTHLAYGFIRGKQFCSVESHKFGTLPEFTKKQVEKVEAMVKKYGAAEYPFTVAAWLQGDLDD